MVLWHYFKDWFSLERDPIYIFAFLALLVKYKFEPNVLVAAPSMSITPIKGMRFVGAQLSASCDIYCGSETPSHKVVCQQPS